MAKEKSKRVHSVKMLQSLRTKLIAIMIVVMAIAFFAFIVVNYTLLMPYYENSKASLLVTSFDEAGKILTADKDYIEDLTELSEESKLRLEIIRENKAVNLYVFRVTNFGGTVFYHYDYPQIDEMQKEILMNLTDFYLYGLSENGQGKQHQKRQLVREEDSYHIYKVYDERIGSNYLELFGQVDAGAFVYLRTSYQSMNESVGIFNQFIGYVTVGVVLFGVVLMVLFGNSFTKPILQITDIAKKMSELDFDVKYPVTTHDEIGVLGSSINMLSETLETTISELKTANNELQKDIERKTQIDEMRKDFLSNVSHELKTPIALIQGYAEGLQENIDESSESREFYCEVIIDEAKKMNRMVQKLLTLNQIEFGNNQVTMERFDLVSLIDNIMQSSGLLAQQKEAELLWDQEYAPVDVWADEYMVEEIVTNYISNAIHHVEGQKKIIVSLEKKEETLPGGTVGKKLVRIKVFNTGKQIPEEDLDKVWIKFYKVDKARTRAYGGSGIGLSIVRAIAESMNRECGVENKPDGVEFWFELERGR